MSTADVATVRCIHVSAIK